ncbi:MAG: FAD:protein FMN transferase [Brevinema sp.]
MSCYRVMLIISLTMQLLGCSSNTVKRYVYQQNLMYTVFDIVAYSTQPKYQIDQSINQIWEKLDDLEYELSPAGEGFVSQLNKDFIVYRHNNPRIFSILSNFIILSKKMHQLSDGAFDLTVYPLIRLWGFYLQDKGQRVPDNQEIQRVLENVGMEHIYLEDDRIILSNGVQLDLGAIAKGYAVDVAIDLLKQNMNISAGFVNAGGNIRVYGTKPDGTPWKVGIRNPNGEDVQEVVFLYDGDSIATSGDYEQYFEKDGNYYHHIFNPKTGSPVTHNLASVSVVLKGSAEMADLLSTTFLSLGKENTIKLLPNLDFGDISLFFIERDNDQLISEANEIWQQRK